MKIVGPILLIPLPSGEEWVNLHDVEYYIDRDGVVGGWRVVVEALFITDMTSRPTVAAMVVAKWGRHGPGTLIHDWLYWFQPCSRAEADKVMLAFMLALGVPGWRARLIYAAVRAGGWKAWRGNRRRREAGEDPFYRGDLSHVQYLAFNGDNPVPK